MNEITAHQTTEIQTQPANSNAASEALSVRSAKEVEAAIFVANRNPRNEDTALKRILGACSRKTLAENAMYQYSRGGQDVSGPSIRLAETLARCWGNIQCGVIELDQRNGMSTCEAYAWDCETNTRESKIFQVPHVRSTKTGNKQLSDARDIYETVANLAARRKRACILAIIPVDIQEAAIHQCEETLQANVDITPETIQKLIDVFKSFGVTREMIEEKIQRKLEAITVNNVLRLRKIATSLRDGMSKTEDFFAKPSLIKGESPLEKAKNKIKNENEDEKENPIHEEHQETEEEINEKAVEACM